MKESGVTIHAHGMHCHGCERIIEHAVGKLAGVRRVEADYPGETVEVDFDPAAARLDDIRAAIERAGYVVSSLDAPKRRRGALANLGGTILALAGIALIVFFDTQWISQGGAPDVTRHLSLTLIFMLGLLTGFHCVGMCGAFVLSYTADDAREGRRSYVSHLLYGAGKTLSYTLIGAAFGALGALVAFTPMLRGAVGLLAGAFLVVYGLNMLGYLTPLRRFRLGLPAPLQAFVDRQAGRRDRPFMIGLLNGLMIVCGPLQAMYVSAAGTGSAVEGAKMLFAFGLGTLPALTAFGVLATVISGALTHRLLELSGAIVILLGAVMMNRGMILTGSGYDLGSIIRSVERATAPKSEAPKSDAPSSGAPTAPRGAEAQKSRPAYQTIEMDVIATGFSPNRFLLLKGVPVRWVIHGKKIDACNNRIVVPALKLEFDVKPGRQVVEFTPSDAGAIPWSCWMGMLHGEFEVADELPASADRPGVVVATPAPAEDRPAAAAATAPSPAEATYVVVQGDTLRRIAVKLYADAARARDIAAANPGLDPRRLRPGQKITLPAPP